MTRLQCLPFDWVLKLIYIDKLELSQNQWIAFGICYFATQTHAKVGTLTHTHTHVPTAHPLSRQSDKVAYQNRKGRDEGEAMGLLFDNGFHQIPLLSQIKMPAWRALAIFLFICLLTFFSFPPPTSVGGCHRISGPIYCHRPATHTRRSQPQSDRPLSYSSHRWFQLEVLIAKLHPPSHHIFLCKGGGGV